MEDQVKQFIKTSKSLQNAAKALEAFLKASRAGDARATTEAGEKALGLLESISGVDSEAAALRASIAATTAESRQRLERERAILAGAVARRLGEAGFKVSGNLPTLFAGFFSMEFTFGSKGLCTLWLGPRKYRLGTAPLDADAIATLVLFFNDRLFPASFDEQAFMAEVETAYRVALVRTRAAYGRPIPLAEIVPEIALMRQKETFLMDPRKESFISWGRAEFAAAMSRVRNRAVGEAEMRLDVATMSQTRKPADHVWVPRPGSLEGMNFATMRFVKTAV